MLTRYSVYYEADGKLSSGRSRVKIDATPSEHARMSSERTEPLRVLIANERPDRLNVTTKIVEKLGHVVIARELQVSDVAAMTAHSMPDVALVAVGESTEHALGLISSIVQEAACP